MRRLIFALLAGCLLTGCCIDVHDEVVALRKVVRVYTSVTVVDPKIDADGDGKPDDPAASERKVADLAATIDQAFAELEAATK